MENLITTIGLIAAFCTTISFIPQALKIIKTKNTKSISLSMYILFVSGVTLWLVYGALTRDFPLVIANGINICCKHFVL